MEKEKLITQSTVLSMGFTKSMIDKLLPAPTLKQNPHYKSSAPMKLWEESVVLSAMETEAFREASAKAERRKAAASKGVDTKRKHAEVLAEELIAAIRVQRIELPELERLALDAQQRWYNFRGRGEIEFPDREDVDRWMVNYIRHDLCEYDATMIDFAKGGESFDFQG